MRRAPTSLAASTARLAGQARPRVLDLFSGCGGISLGFKTAGFDIAGAVEFDPQAAASHGANFHPGDARHALARDITATSPAALAQALGLGDPGSAVEVIVGGPPCQAFARVGRSKLREIRDHPEAFTRDPRARLYLQYLAYVEAFRPLALLMENVPDVLNHGGRNIAEEVCEALEDMGYVAAYTLLNAALYGVPQMRQRMILVAYRRELGAEVAFPAPTHHIDLPQGYASSRQVALKLLRTGVQADGRAPSRYVAAPEALPDLPPAITAREALGDLPQLTAHLHGESRRGVRRFDRLMPYPSASVDGYAALMRAWPGFESPHGVSDHVIRHLPRDWKLFAAMAHGDQYPEAHALAQRMFHARLGELDRDGHGPADAEEWARLHAEFVPPYDPGKFPNKWRKMEPDLPARTLMAHLGKDSYSHIHHDSVQARTISVREAARLQSFPDGFVFRGTMNPAFRQIGNAVPPLLAQAVASTMLDTLRRAAAAPLLARTG